MSPVLEKPLWRYLAEHFVGDGAVALANARKIGAWARAHGLVEPEQDPLCLSTFRFAHLVSMYNQREVS